MIPKRLAKPISDTRDLSMLGMGRFTASADGEIYLYSWQDGDWVDRLIFKGEMTRPTDVRLLNCRKTGLNDLWMHNIRTQQIELYPPARDGMFTNDPLVLRQLEASSPMTLLHTNGCGPLVTIEAGFLNVQELLPDGTLSLGTSFPLEGSRYYHAQSADLRGDGFPEIITLDAGNRRLVAVDPRSGEERTLLQGERLELGQFVIGDLNGDGALDLVTGLLAVQKRRGDLVVLMNAGDGTFLPAIHIPGVPRPWSLALADFDGDSRMDIAWSASGEDGILGISYQEPDGTFHSRVISSGHSEKLGAVATPDGAVLLATKVYEGGVLALKDDGKRGWSGRMGVLFGSKPNAVLTADLDGDDRLEHVVSLPDENAIAIVGEDWSPRFLDVGETIPGPLLDVDFGCGTGSELLVLDLSKVGAAGKVVHQGSNGPEILREFEHMTATDALVKDMDGDGRLDIVITGFSAGAHVEVIWNDGGCSFDQRTSHSLRPGITPMAVTIGDFTAKGELEVAVADFHAGSVTILSLSREAWTEVLRLEDLREPIAMESCDWDGEPGDEIIISSYAEGTVEVFRFGAEGPEKLETYWNRPSFWPEEVLPLRSLVAGDFDGDGRCDFITGGFRGTYLGVMSRNGRTVDEGMLSILGSWTPLALEFVRDGGKPTLVFVSSGDNLLVRARMEFVPSTD